MKNSFALNTGYACARMETFRFGTFEGLQVIPFCSIMPNSLLDQKPHIMFVGPNGAGKTTLMDALWTLLMPDERFLRLGVVQTASPTKGPRGVRKVSEYVLGKHLSTDEQGNGDESKSPYLRKTGASIIIAVFVHRETGRAITLGRLWWYSDYHVKEDSVFFVAKEDFSIASKNMPNLMSASGVPYDSARSFLKGVRQSYGNRVDVTTNGTDYFRTYSDVMGGISKEDILLLMKAANAKDVESVDSFVREYMLVPYQNDSVEVLEEQVRAATSIAAKIEKTTNKMKKAKEIVDDFSKLESHYDLLFDGRIKRQIVSLLEQIDKRNEANAELSACSIGIYQSESLIPDLEKQRTKYKEEFRALSTVVLASDEAIKSGELKNQISIKHTDLLEREKDLQVALNIAAKSGLKPFKKTTNREDALSSIDRKVLSIEKMEASLDDKRQENEGIERELNRRLNELANEVSHLERNQTLIPNDLYQIKTDLIQSLGISKEDVMFVGEVLAVPSDNAEFEKAAKAVLNPIARRLMVHPDHLHRVDQWLNKYKNKETITIQRLHSGDMAKRNFPKLEEDSILTKIIVRNQSDNIFFYAISNWLRNDYDFKIISIDDFSKDLGKVVTLEGYIKTSARQSTKYKENLNTPLGWDIASKKAALKEDLKVTQKNYLDIKAALKSIKDELGTYAAIQFQLKALRESGLRFLEIPTIEDALLLLEKQLELLEHGNPEYVKLKERLSQTEAMAEDIYGQIKVEEQKIKDFKKRETELSTRVSALSIKIESIQASEIDRGESLEKIYNSKELEAELAKLSLAAQKKGQSISDLLNEINDNLNKLSEKSNVGSLSRNLRDFEKDFHDSNMEYVVRPDKESSTRAQSVAWKILLREIEETELPSCRDEWNSIYTSRLFEAIKDFVNDRKKGLQGIEEAIALLNEGISDTVYEVREGFPVVLQLFKDKNIKDDRIRKFSKLTDDLEEIFGAKFKALATVDQARVITDKIEPFTKFMEDVNTREYVIDPRNHFVFSVKSFKKMELNKFEEVETFRGSARDKKSGGQTVQLCYTLLGMALAQRFHFHDRDRGYNTPRLIVLDEFADKLDNEKPSAVVSMYSNMGFQGIVLSPFSKVDLLRPHMNKLIAVNKDQNSSHSRAYEFALEDLTAEQLEDLKDAEEMERV